MITNHFSSNFWDAATGGLDFLGNIISSWQFTSSDSTDSTGSNNGTDSSMSYATGKVGNCADFSATAAAQISVADSSTLTFGDGSTDVPFSISFYVKFDAFVSISNVIHKYKNPYEYLIELSSSGSILTFISRDNSAAANLGRRIASTGFTTGTWYHIVCTCDGSGTAAGYEIYVDSVASATQSVGSGTYTAMEDTSSPLYFGRNGNNNNRSLDGFLDEIFFWDIELDQTQIDDLYALQNAGTDILA